MKVAQRLVSAALVISAAACANTGLGGGLGNILGGVLGNQPMQVGGTIQGVDTRNQMISMYQSNGQSMSVSYDGRTRVVYQNSFYPVTSLQSGDQVVARLIDNGNNGYYTDSVYVTAPVNGSNNGGTYYPNNSASNAQSFAGNVQQVDRNAGWFSIANGTGVVTTVTMPYRANSADINRFNNLRVGDYVRFAGVYVNSNQVQLSQFY